jgi:hypothetical protein
MYCFFIENTYSNNTPKSQRDEEDLPIRSFGTGGAELLNGIYAVSGVLHSEGIIDACGDYG